MINYRDTLVDFKSTNIILIFLLLKDYVYFIDKNGPNLTKNYYVLIFPITIQSTRTYFAIQSTSFRADTIGSLS